MLGEYCTFEYPDVDRLAHIMRNGYRVKVVSITGRETSTQIDISPELHMAIRQYLAHAKLSKKGIWRVGVNYTAEGQGRRFVTAGLQKLSNAIRCQVANDYIDVDFSNCGYHLMRDLMAQYGLACPWISYYIDNRKECLSGARGGGISPKEQFIATLNGSTIHTGSDVLVGIQAEILILHNYLDGKAPYAEYVRGKVADAQKELGMTPEQAVSYLDRMATTMKSAKFNALHSKIDYEGAMISRQYMASYVANLTYKMEAVCLEALISAVKKQLRAPNLSVVRVFDGAMFHKVDGNKLDLRAIEASILKSTGHDMKVAIKPMVDPAVKLDNYPRFTGLTAEEFEGVSHLELDEFPCVYPGLPIEMTATIHLDKENRVTNNEALKFIRLITEDGQRYFELSRVNGAIVKILDQTMRRCARPAFCITNHKSQGRTIEGSMAVHQYYQKKECGQWTVTPRWRYTALTRARDPEQVYVVAIYGWCGGR